MTGDVPGHLVDHQDLKPHERASAKLALDQIPSASLRPLFDKGFEHVLVKRFRSFPAFKGRLHEVLDDLEHSQMALEENAETVILEAITPEIKTVSSEVRQSSLGSQQVEPKEMKSKANQEDLLKGEHADALMLASLLGAWDERVEGDRDAIARAELKDMIKDSDQWISSIREASLLPDTPIKQKDGRWKIAERLESWKEAGPRIFDEYLDRLQKLAVDVLVERNPHFELAPDRRYAASMHGKVMKHSHQLRRGLAETLAFWAAIPNTLSLVHTGRQRPRLDGPFVQFSKERTGNCGEV